MEFGVYVLVPTVLQGVLILDLKDNYSPQNRHKIIKNPDLSKKIITMLCLNCWNCNN